MKLPRRIRILWADDQQEVAETISKVLVESRPKITFARSGEEAVQILRKDYFDLAIVDLRMPPGTWGGVMFLEYLRQHARNVPVIVLSGEGAQQETIQALRLGADDYVVKEKARAELSARVSSVLKSYAARAAHIGVHALPVPIALPLKRYQSSSTSVLRLRRLFELLEGCLKFTSYVGLASLSCADPASGSVVEFMSQLGRPSMGKWFQTTRGLLAAGVSFAGFTELQRALTVVDIEGTIGRRNDVVHGTDPSEVKSAQLLASFEHEVETLIRMLVQRYRFRLVFVENYRLIQGSSQLTCVEFIGEGPAFGPAYINREGPFESGHVCLLSADDGPDLDLYPFLVAEGDTDPLTWRVSMFDGFDQKHSSALSGQETIKYTELHSGNRSSSADRRLTLSNIPGFVRAK